MKSVQQFIKRSFLIFFLGISLVTLISLIIYWNNVYKSNLKLIDEVNFRINLTTANGVRNARNNLLVAEALLRNQILKNSFSINFAGTLLASSIHYNPAQNGVFVALSEKYSKMLKDHPQGQRLLITRLNQEFELNNEELQVQESTFDIGKYKLSLYSHDLYYKDPWYQVATKNAGRFIYTEFYFDKNYTKRWIVTFAKSIYDIQKNLIGIVGVDFLISNVEKAFSPLAGKFGLIAFQSSNGSVIINIPSANFSILPKNASIGVDISSYIKNFKTLINEEVRKKLGYKRIDRTWIVYKVYKMPAIPWHFIVYQKTLDFFSPIIPFIFISCIVAFSIVGSFIYFLHKSKKAFFPPIKNLLDSIKRDYASAIHNQNISTKYPLSNVLEVNEITNYINKLFEAISTNFHNYQIEFDKNIKSKEVLLANEKMARAEAEKSIRLRDDFLSIASHELKTPLTPIRLQIGFVKKNIKEIAADHPKSAILIKALDNTDKQFERFLKLVDDLLDVSRITADRLIIKKEEINLSELFQQKINDYIPEFSLAGCEVVTDIEQEIIGFWDKIRIEQVMNNLFSNAKKYGHGKPIELMLSLVKSENHADMARLVVRDHGIGIAEQDFPRLFSRFERISPVYEYEGLGLGLYIAFNIVKAHGGQIKVESAPNMGATFIVELPISG